MQIQLRHGGDGLRHEYVTLELEDSPYHVYVEQETRGELWSCTGFDETREDQYDLDDLGDSVSLGDALEKAIRYLQTKNEKP